MTPDDIQAMLDKDTDRIAGMIKRYGHLADQLCEANKFQESALVREGVGYLNLAMAIGRKAQFDFGGDVIQPKGGGK